MLGGVLAVFMHFLEVLPFVAVEVIDHAQRRVKGSRVHLFSAGKFRVYRKAQLELRMALGAGRLPDDAFVFGTTEGKPRDRDRLTQDWKRLTAARNLPKVTLHALRHSHSSALIKKGTDPVMVSRRLGHASAEFTLATYVH